ncbi:MAG: phosphoribosylformylglycinamidine synthase, partial [Oscillospiraceae bacterium]
ITSLTGLRLFNRYDVEDIGEAIFSAAIPTVFSEPQLDNTYKELPSGEYTVFAIEYLPGQFDARAASCAECIQLQSMAQRPTVRTARVFALSGNISSKEIEVIKKYLINPVEAREASLEIKDTIKVQYELPTDVKTLDGFIGLDKKGLADFVNEYSLAMDNDDIALCQKYFIEEKREPTITEIRMLDTYWSDHCRHTTFGTIIDETVCDDELCKQAYDMYLDMRKTVHAGKNKPICLMDLATIGAKYLKKQGILKNLDESDEINACSVRITVDNNGKDEDYLLLFKNETHNHPTEIEPFGGAATCIGGAIRDPLANRGYVYQAMRVTGAGDPLVPIKDTMKGKLPQRKLVTTAAAGYSSYGNQIGLATGMVDEIYHEGYKAKRMEIGAVVGAVPEANVRREEPSEGDIVILLGGRTGRDGCGGATGSSKAHKLESLETCGAEVQKGNAPVERKLQRLFRSKDVTRMIRRCNDFGAGGVSVAIGELADGLIIDLDKVPKKYDGLDGTELAISESQERMAVVVEAKDKDAFIEAANAENLEATAVAVVTKEKRLVMQWQGKTIVDIDRAFLSSNGAEKHANVFIEKGTDDVHLSYCGTLEQKLTALMSDLNICSKKGLSERFDSTIGAGTVLMPFGGKYQMTPIQAMAAKLPVMGETKTCSGMAWGFNPFIAEKSPYKGAYLAVLESVAKLVAEGFSAKNAYLTFQEYFERLYQDAARWGKPMAALLGALKAQVDLGVGAIGGKDSMSGSFENIDVPPTLVSFAIAAGNTDNVISPEFKAPCSTVVLLRPQYENGLPVAKSQVDVFNKVEKLIKDKKVLSAYTLGIGGIAQAICKMSMGNRVGVRLNDNVTDEMMYGYGYGSFILELAESENIGIVIGETSGKYIIENGNNTADMAVVQAAYEGKLESVMPYHTNIDEQVKIEKISFVPKNVIKPKIGCAKPHALIPVFPGTNCEYDTQRAVERAGGEAEIFIVNNLSAQSIKQSAKALVKSIDNSQMIILPGGFSGGDEPDGSAKFIVSLFRNPEVSEAVQRLLQQRD